VAAALPWWGGAWRLRPGGGWRNVRGLLLGRPGARGAEATDLNRAWLAEPSRSAVTSSSATASRRERGRCPSACWPTSSPTQSSRAAPLSAKPTARAPATRPPKRRGRGSVTPAICPTRGQSLTALEGCPDYRAVDRVKARRDDETGHPCPFRAVGDTLTVLSHTRVRCPLPVSPYGLGAGRSTILTADAIASRRTTACWLPVGKELQRLFGSESFVPTMTDITSPTGRNVPSV